MNFSNSQFRRALGSFTTGVTIITTTDGGGSPEGITVNSFASVSLSPPLVLWSIDKQANCFDTFNNTGHFAIHVLYNAQRDLSILFASRNTGKFSGLSWTKGNNGSPLLEDCISRFECTMENRYAGGDHVILLGRVTGFDILNDREPLLFHNGMYR